MGSTTRILLRSKDPVILSPYRYVDCAKEMDHVEFWERHVSRTLASNWSVKVAVPFNKLWKLLKEHPYGLPRGRVACVGDSNQVYHGSDLPDAPNVNPLTIETIFGLVGTAKWTGDDHEHCSIDDKMVVRGILALEEDWKAV